MIYTSEDLKNMSDSSFDMSKWGKDASTVLNILKKIQDSNCTSCALRRNLALLKEIFNKYGDDIVYTPASYAVKSTKRDKPIRIPCNDCVAKHLSQAYVLQGEFYQGYTEYLALIEAHLYEALEECPADNPALRIKIRDAINRISIDRVPDVPEVIYTSSPSQEVKPYNNTDRGKDLLNPALDSHSDMESELSKVSETAITVVRALLDNSMHSDYMDAVINSKRRKLGSMAQAAEFISKYSPPISKLLRDRRLAIQDCISRDSLEEINPLWVENTDILDVLEKLTKST